MFSAGSAVLHRTLIVEGQTRDFEISGIASRPRYFLHFSVAGSFSAEAGDVTASTNDLLGRALAIAPDSDGPRAYPDAVYKRIRFEVTANSDSDGAGDETFGVRLCTTADCVGGTVLGDWTVTVEEPEPDTVVAGAAGATVTVLGGSRLTMMESSRNDDPRDKQARLRVALASSPTSDLVLVARTGARVATGPDAEGNATFRWAARGVGPASQDAPEHGVEVARWSSGATGADLTKEAVFFANDNVADAAGGAHTGTFTFRLLVLDARYTDGANGNGTVYGGVTIPDVPFSVIDDDSTRVRLLPASPPDNTATEGDSSDTAKFRVRIDRALAGTEEVSVPLRFIGATLGTEFTIALDGTPMGASLDADKGVVTFAGAGAQEATVVVTAAADDGNNAAETLSVNIPQHSDTWRDRHIDTNLAGGACSGVACPGYDKNEGAQRGYKMTLVEATAGLTVIDTGGGRVDENSGTYSYTVRLNSAPTANVTVAVSSQSTHRATVTTGASLTFTPSGSSIWSMPQTVTVRGVNDNIDAADAAVTIAHAMSSSDSNYSGIWATHQLTVVDDDATDVTMTGAGVRATSSDSNISEVMLEGDATRVDRSLTISLSRPLVEGEYARIPLILRAEGHSTVDGECDTSGSDSPDEAYRHCDVVEGFRGPRISANVAWPVHHNDFAMAATGAGVSLEAVNRYTPNYRGYRILEFSGAGAQTATFALHARDGFDDGEGFDEEISVGFLNDAEIEALWTGKFDAGIQVETDGKTAWFGIDDDEPSQAGGALVNPDWTPLPSGLAGGDAFRLIYVTSQTTTATSSSLSTYDAFVRAEITGNHLANGGVADMAPHAPLFRAIGENEDTAARDHAEFNTNDPSHPDVPIYWVGGNKVADDNADFVDGTWDDEANPRHADGSAATISADGYWTGSIRNGDASGQSCDEWRNGVRSTPRPRLGVVHVTAGFLNSSDALGFPLGPPDRGSRCGEQHGYSHHRSEQRPMYALSGVFVVDAEPGVAIADASAAEGSPITFTVTLPDGYANTAGVSVPYTLSDGRGVSGDPAYIIATGASGGTGADYDNDAGSVTIPANSSSATFSVATAQDSTYESDHYFTVMLGTPTSTGTPPPLDSLKATAIGTITDAADKPTIQFSPATASASETGGTATLTVTRTGTTLVPSAVTWTTADGTGASAATHPGDYTSATGTAQFAAGDTSKTITVDITADSVSESAETFTVGLGDPVDATLGSASTATVTVTDADTGALPTVDVTLSASDGNSDGNPVEGGSGAEGYKTITITLSRALASGQWMQVPLTVQGATVTDDYTFRLRPLSHPGVTLLRGSTQTPGVQFTSGAQTATLRLTPVQNNRRSQPAVSISAGAPVVNGVTAGEVSGGPIVFSIVDDESGAIMVGPATFGLAPSGLSAGDRFRLIFVTSQTRTAESADIDDYNTWVQGVVARGGHADLLPYGGLVRVIGATAAVEAREQTGMWDPSLNSGSGGWTDGSTSDSDSGVAVYWLAAPSSDKVADNYFDFFDDTWDGGTDQSQEATNEAGAGRGSTAIWTGTFTNGRNTVQGATIEGLGHSGSIVGFGNTNAAGNNSLYESSTSKTNTLPMFGVSPVFEVAAQATPVLSFHAATYRLDEDHGLGSVLIRVNASPAPSGNLTVNLSSADGSATAGDDYTAPAATFTFPAGQTSHTFNVAIIDDNADESADETFTLTLTAASDSSYTLGSPATTTVTIVDDDAPPVTVTMSASDGDANGNAVENGAGTTGYRTITVTLGRPLTGAETVTVPLTVQGATVADDYTFGLHPATQTGVTLLNSGTTHTAQNPALRFVSGGTSATLRLRPVNDSDREQPYAVVAYGTDARAPSGANVTLGDVTGGPIGIVLVDDETGAVKVPSSWGLVPSSGVGPGDDFRLLFRTSTGRDAASTDIADYDAFIREVLATGGHADILPYAGFFKVFGSTRSSSGSTGTTARVHNGMTAAHTGHNPTWADGSGTDSDAAGTPTYWLNGARLANNYRDLCDQAWSGSGTGVLNGFDRDDPRSEDGTRNVPTGSISDFMPYEPWTGSGNACEAWNHPLGASTVSRGGADSGASLWHANAQANTQTRPLYGMSPVFSVEGAAAELSVSASGTVTEGGTLTVTVTLNTSADANLSIPVRMRTSGAPTASSADFTLSNGGSVAITSGSSSGTLTFNATDDRIDEDAETLVLEFGALPAGVVAGSADSVAVTINDNDTAAVTVTPSGGTTTVNEDGSDTDDYTVVLGSQPLSNVTITATAPAGTQVSDDGGSTWGSSVDLVFTAGMSGNWGTAQTVTVRGTQDIIDNPGDQRSVTITHAITSGNGDGSRYTPTAPSIGSVPVTVTDDDEAPKVITLSVDDSTVGEGDGATTITVTATVVGATRFGVAQEVDVTVAATADSLINYVDMAPVSTFTITIPAGAQSATGMFTLTPDNDIVDEADNTVMVTGSIMGTSTPGIASAQITLTDDDATPTSVTLSVNPTSITENGGARTVAVTATVDGGTLFANTVTVAVDVDGYDSQGRVNFSQVASFNISILRGAASGSGSFTLTPTNNNWDEQHGAAALTGTLLDLTVNGASVTITDDDAAPTGVALSVDESTIAEGAGATSVTVTATVQGSTRYGSDRTVTVSQAGSGDANVVGYTATAPEAITIAAGAASSTTTFMLTPTDDATDEFNETVTVSGSGAGVASFSSASITLTDDDDTTLTISAPAGGIAESGGTKDVTLTLSRALVDGETVTVPLEVVGATAGSDYTLALQPSSQAGVSLSTSGSDSVQQPKVTLSTGASAAVLRFTALDDALRQQPYLVVKYGTGGRAPSGSGIGLAAPGDDSVGFVLTDDETGVIGVLPSWGLMPSAAATLRHDFRLVFVTSGMRDASSADIADYDHFVRRHLAEGHADIVPYAGFFTALGSTSAVTLQNHASVAGGASMNFYWLGETGTTGERRLAGSNSNFRGEWLEGSTPSQQSVPRDESGALAAVAANGYFTGSTAAGARSANPLGSANVTVGYLNDGGAGRAPLGSGQTASSTATRSFYGLSPVFDYLSDPAISITSATATVTEGTSITFTVEADRPPTANLPVNLAVGSSGSVITMATEGIKYSAVTILAGSTSATYTVATSGDSTDEPDGAVTVGVVGGSDYVLDPFASTAVVTVTDNDAMTVAVSGGGGTVNEGASLDYTVDPGRNLASSETVTVNFAPAGTATQGDDYTISCHGSGVSCTGLAGATPVLTITGGSGVRQGTIRVSVSDDSAHPETGETAGISLRSGHGSTGSGGAFSVSGTPTTFTVASVAPVGDGVEVPANWALIPSGLSGGDSFRLLFVSSTKRDASSTDIADYNSFVQARAAAGHAALASHSSAFRAVASTASVDARDNTSTTGTGVPVYWVGGQKVADDYADFYDASWDSCVARDESGGSVALPNTDATLANAIWTGTKHDGTAETAHALGTTMPRVALLAESCDSRYSATAFPLRFQFTTGTKANTSNRYLYGLSPVFKVAGTAVTPVVSVTAGSAVIEGGNAVFTIAASPAATGTISVRYTVTQNGQFLASGQLGSGKQRSLSGASATISIPTDSDSVDEADGSVTVTLTGGTGYTVGSPAAATVTVTDNDVPQAQFALASASAAESAGTRNVRVNLSPVPYQNLTISYTVGGNAARNTDYTVPSTVQATAGSAFVDIPVAITDDSAPENAETIVLTLTAGSGYGVGSVRVHTLTITDDDTAATPVTVTLSAAAGDVTEGAAGAAGRKDMTITLGRALSGSETVTVPLSVQGAAAGSDYSFGLQPATQAGVTLLVSSPHSAQNPAVRFSAGASSAVLRFSPVNNAVRTQPYVVIGYGSGARAPGGGGGATLGAVTGGPVAFAVVDDETGDITVPSSWALAPSGLGAGDDFRLLFRTSTTRDATSSDIADYDFFVRNVLSLGGHSAALPYAGFFKAFASTRSSSGTTGTTARVHNGMASGHTGHFNGANDVWADGSTVPNAGNTAGTPIYWLNGAKLANNYADLCDQAVKSGSGVTTGWDIDDPRSETGNRNIASGVNPGQGHQAWTGTGNSCEAYDYPLGNSPNVSRAASHDVTWAFMHEGQSANTQQRPLYAMSPVFKIAGTAVVPVADFASAASTAAESAGTRNITVRLVPAPAQSVTVAYTLSGTAVRGSDYTISGVTSNSGMVAVGTSGTATIPVAIADDSANEGDETVVLTLSAPGGGAGYVLGSPTAFTLTILDDDANPATPRVSFVHESSSVTEYDVARYPSFTISPAPAAPITIHFAIDANASTATLGADYKITWQHPYTLHDNDRDGIWEGAITAPTTAPAYGFWRLPTVRFIDDRVRERDETIVLRLLSGPGYTLGDITTYTVTIDDNESGPLPPPPPPEVPQVSVTAGPAVDEGTAATFAVSASPAASGTVTVRYTVTQNGQFVTSGQLGSNKTRTLSGAGATISIPTQNDSADEADGSVTVTLTAGSGYTVGTPATATVTVRDDDVPTAQFAAAASTAAESAGTRNVAVRLVPAPAQSTTVSYALSGTAVRGSDYTISGVTSNTGTVTVGASGTATIPVAITDDSATESAETVVLTLTGGAGYDIGANQSHTLTITDNDTAGVPQVSVTAGPAVDEGTAATFAVSASPAASGTVTVRYTVTQNGQFVTSGQLGSNKTRTLSGAGATISIPTQNDSADEADGSVTVTLTAGSGYTVGTPATATVTVRDDDVPTALFATAAASVDESAGIRQVRVNLNPAPHRGITVGYTIGGSATRGTDFTAAGSVSVTAGATFVDIPVTIIDDSGQEPDETVVLTLTGGVGYQVGSRRSHTLTITDQDVSPTAAFATAAEQASEGTGTHQVTLTVLPAPATPITVRYTIGGTATRGADYTAPSGTITVAANATTAAIYIPITNDSANEGDETVVLTLSAPGGGAGYVLGSPTAFTLTILDDDANPATPRVSFVHESSSVTEYDVARYPSFTISPAPAAPITIHFAIDANASTATLGADYKITWQHPYTLHDNDRDGIWEGAITAPTTAPAYGYWRLPTVRFVNDSAREPNETIVLRLLNGPGYTLGDISTYTITITDND